MIMKNPPHPGTCIRDSVTESGWTVSETARRLGIPRQTLSRLINGNSSISPTIALALESIGWSNAEFWMRLQASYDLAQEKDFRQSA